MRTSRTMIATVTVTMSYSMNRNSIPRRSLTMRNSGYSTSRNWILRSIESLRMSYYN
jgi:hypothetical protein